MTRNRERYDDYSREYADELRSGGYEPWEDDRSGIPPGTARIKKTACPICGAVDKIEVRTWQGAWVSGAQGEAMTNHHYRTDATCGCSLSEMQMIQAYYDTEKDE